MQPPPNRPTVFPLARLAAALLVALAGACAGAAGDQYGAEPGETYPNLASVPARPARVPAAEQAARTAALEAERAEAEQRRRSLEAGGLTSLGSVAPDRAGRFPPADEAILRRAASAGRIRLAGPAASSLAAADRLAALGVDRSRIELVAAPAGPAASRVEILVASGRPGR